MKIAYNPTTAAALTAAPSNNDITFDLKGVAIYAKGVKFKGTDTTYSVFKKHTVSGNTGGYNGLVPVPSYTTTAVRFLREDGTWVTPTNTTYSVVSSTANGLAPAIGTTCSTTIATQANEWVLTSTKGGTPTWRKLPTNAFKNDNTNTTYTLSGGLSGNNYTVTLTPSSGTATNAIIPTMVGATSSAAGKEGLVPLPTTEDRSKFLRGDGVWTAISIPNVSITNSGSGNAIASLLASGHTITATKGNFLPITTISASTDLTTLTANALYYIDTDRNASTLTNSPWSTSFTMLQLQGFSSGDDVRRYRLAINGYGAAKLFNDRDTGGSGGSWVDVLTSINSSVSGDGGSTWGSSITVKINGVSKTLTIPSNPNVDTKVTLTNTTGSANYRVLLSANANNTTETTTARKSGKLLFNPSTGILTVTGISSSLSTSTYLKGNQGTAIINSTAEAGYNMLAKMNSTNGVFTMGMYNSEFKMYYTAKTTIDAGTNSITKGATLLDESGNSSFPGTVTANKFTGTLTNTLTFSAGAFTTKTYNNSAAVTVNIPTHTSHLTNNSGFLTAHLSLSAYYKVQGLMGTTSGAWDWDSYSNFGTYKVQTGSTITNHPTYAGTSQAYHYGLAMVINGKIGDSEGRVAQMYFPHYWTSSNIPLYIRMRNSSTWTSWAKIPSTDYINTTNFPGLNKTGTVTSVTVTGANGLSGTGTITTSGTITLSNTGVRSVTINSDYLRVNTNGTNNDLTIPYATKAGRLVSNSDTNLGGLSYYYAGGIVSSTDKTGAFAGPSTSTIYSSVLRLLSHTRSGRLYYRDLIFDVNSDEIWSRRVTKSGDPVVRTLLHSGNTYIKNGVITINDTSITPLTSHQSLANYVTLDGTQTISGVKTFSKQLKFTVSTGSPFTVSSTTKVSNLNSDMVDGYHISTAGTTKPWSTIVTIGSDGVSEMGRYIDFHYDNTTGSDYSTRLLCGGNHSNVVTLPSATGTLALTSQIPSVGNGTITIKLAGSTKGSFTMNQSGNATIELTDNNTWRSITDSYAGTDSTISLSQKGANNLYTSAINYGTSLSPYNASATGWYLFLTLVGTTNDGQVDFIVSGAETGTNISVADYFHFAARPSSPNRVFVYTHLGANKNYLRDNIYVYTDDNKTYRFYMKYSSAGSWNWFCKIKHISSRGCTLTWASTWQTANPSGTAYQASFSGAVAYASNADTIDNYHIAVQNSVGSDPNTIYFII